MRINYDYVKQRIRLKEIPKIIKRNKSYNMSTYPNGIVIFSGEQGSGKSLCAMAFIEKIKSTYPCIVISNTDDLKAVRYEGIKTITDVYENNTDKQIILYIDEITSEFNSLDSKEFNTDWFTIINMMRKRNLIIIGTCPLFTRLSKAFREQFDTWFICRKAFFGLCIVLEQYINSFDGSDVSDDTINNDGCVFVRRYRHWIYEIDYDRYDTTAIIKTVRKEVKKK